MQQLYSINEALIDDLRAWTLRALDASVSELTFLTILYPHKVLADEVRPAITDESIKRLLETCLYASLEREEGKFNNFAVVLEPPDPEFKREQFLFKNPIPFNATSLKKLSPAINQAKYQIGVWPDGDGTLKIWGYKPNLNWFLSINSISPGKISYSCISNATTSFKCLISLSETGVINPLSQETNPITKWISEGGDIVALQKMWDFNYVFARMFQMGDGGAVLLVKDKENWKSAVRNPVLYELSNPDSADQFPQIKRKYDVWREMASKAEANIDIPENEKPAFRDKLALVGVEARIALDNVANLTRVDGATIIDEDFSVLAFGAKIRTENEYLSKIMVEEPFGESPAPVPIAEIGGTRHQSAAHFVYHQRDSLAVVVSEDRRISIFSWDHERKAVVQLKNVEFLVLG